jgi:hypothetical protein
MLITYFSRIIRAISAHIRNLPQNNLEGGVPSYGEGA